MKFSQGKCQALPLGKDNPVHAPVQAGAEQLESSSPVNDLGVLVDTRLARSLLGCNVQSVASRSRGDPSHLPSTVGVTSGVLGPVLLGSAGQERYGRSGESPAKTHKVD